MNEFEVNFPDIDLSNIKGVLIDLDDTLYRYAPCHSHAIDICSTRAVETWGQIEKDAFLSIYREKRTLVTDRLNCGSSARSRLIAFLWVFEALGIKHAYYHAEIFDRLYWQSFIEFMRPSQSALNFLSMCYQSDIPVCLVSDMQMSVQVRKLEALGMMKYITHMVTSEEIGIEKPDPLIFNAALNKLDLDPSEVIMIGDSQSKDCAGAERLGIKAYKVTGVHG